MKRTSIARITGASYFGHDTRRLEIAAIETKLMYAYFLSVALAFQSEEDLPSGDATRIMKIKTLSIKLDAALEKLYARFQERLAHLNYWTYSKLVPGL